MVLPSWKAYAFLLFGALVLLGCTQAPPVSTPTACPACHEPTALATPQASATENAELPPLPPAENPASETVPSAAPQAGQPPSPPESVASGNSSLQASAIPAAMKIGGFSIEFSDSSAVLSWTTNLPAQQSHFQVEPDHADSTRYGRVNVGAIYYDTGLFQHKIRLTNLANNSPYSVSVESCANYTPSADSCDQVNGSIFRTLGMDPTFYRLNPNFSAELGHGEALHTVYQDYLPKNYWLFTTYFIERCWNGWGRLEGEGIPHAHVVADSAGVVLAGMRYGQPEPGGKYAVGSQALFEQLMAVCYQQPTTMEYFVAPHDYNTAYEPSWYKELGLLSVQWSGWFDPDFNAGYYSHRTMGPPSSSCFENSTLCGILQGGTLPSTSDWRQFDSVCDYVNAGSAGTPWANLFLYGNCSRFDFTAK